MRTPNDSNEEQRQKRRDERANADRNRPKSGQNGSTQPQPDNSLGATEEGKKLLAVAGKIPPSAEPQNGASKEKVEIDRYTLPEIGDVESLLALVDKKRAKKIETEKRIDEYDDKVIATVEALIPVAETWGDFASDLKFRETSIEEIEELRKPIIIFLKGINFVSVKQAAAKTIFDVLLEKMPQDAFGVWALVNYLLELDFAKKYQDKAENAHEVLFLQGRVVRKFWLQPQPTTPEGMMEGFLQFVESPMAAARTMQEEERKATEAKCARENLVRLTRFYEGTVPLKEARKVGGDFTYKVHDAKGYFVGEVRLSAADEKIRVVDGILGCENFAREARELLVEIRQKDLLKPQFQSSEMILKRRHLMEDIYDLLKGSWKAIADDETIESRATKNPQYAPAYEAIVERKQAVSTYLIDELKTELVDKRSGEKITYRNLRLSWQSGVVEEKVEVKKGEETVVETVKQWKVRILGTSFFAAWAFEAFTKEFKEVNPSPKGNLLERFFYEAGNELKVERAKAGVQPKGKTSAQKNEQPTPAPVEPVNTSENGTAEVPEPKAAQEEVVEATSENGETTPEPNGSNGTEGDTSTPDESVEPTASDELVAPEVAQATEEVQPQSEVSPSPEEASPATEMADLVEAITGETAAMADSTSEASEE